jgi:hypothetical protein
MNLSDIKIGDKVTFPDGTRFIVVSEGGAEGGNVPTIGLLPYESKEKTMAIFDDAKIREKVWDYNYGWGEIIVVDRSDTPIKVLFKYKDKEAWFDSKGVECDSSRPTRTPTLFWDEVKIVPPERPKEHECSFKENPTRQETVTFGRCECGGRGTISTSVENINPLNPPLIPSNSKVECKACGWLMNASKITFGDTFNSEVQKFLLNQHHAEGCEKRK